MRQDPIQLLAPLPGDQFFSQLKVDQHFFGRAIRGSTECYPILAPEAVQTRRPDLQYPARFFSERKGMSKNCLNMIRAGK